MPDGFPLGPLYVRFYGIILMLGAVAGAWLATREAKRRGYEPEIVWDLLTYLLIGGIIGARLWHIFTPPPSSGITAGWYLTHPLDALAVWKGGLGIPGAVIGGIIVLYFYTRRHKLNFAEWADICAPSLALGQAIGRWGNFFNQELYGAPTNLPWKLFIDPEHRLANYQNVEYYHPLFLYESLWNLGNMFLLLWISRRFADRLKNGDLFLIYLIVYPVGRFLLDFLRCAAAFFSSAKGSSSCTTSGWVTTTPTGGVSPASFNKDRSISAHTLNPLICAKWRGGWQCQKPIFIANSGSP